MHYLKHFSLSEQIVTMGELRWSHVGSEPNAVGSGSLQTARRGMATMPPDVKPESDDAE